MVLRCFCRGGSTDGSSLEEPLPSGSVLWVAPLLVSSASLPVMGGSSSDLRDIVESLSSLDASASFLVPGMPPSLLL